MRFQVDHDWQGNMSTPRARIGDGAKTQLLLLLCAIWILVGLVGHAPWKPLESSSINIVKNILDGGSVITPLAIGETIPSSPPLYYLCAAASAKLLSPLLSIHDGARIFNSVWLVILLLMVGMSGRELWSQGSGRHATFILIGTIGLVISAHSLNAGIANLACLATGFYALALAKRRPWRASVLLGSALGVGFLTFGLMPVLILLSTALFLPLVFKLWRTRSYAKFLILAILIASPIIMPWLLYLEHHYPTMLSNWWQFNLNTFKQQNYVYFLRILSWYAWPALPLALLGFWQYRRQLLSKPKFQLMIGFFICCIFFLGLGASTKDINALPLLLPLVALAAGSVELLKRGAAAALNWFGVMLFGLVGILIWLGWIAVITGYPVKINERMQFLSGVYHLNFNWLEFVTALFITFIWMLVCIRAKQTNKSTVTNWAVGMTFGWSLLMTLWLPLIDSAKSYQPVFLSMNKILPNEFDCMNSLGVGIPQSQLLNYYTNIQLQPFEKTNELTCNYYLIQDVKGTGIMQPGDDWKEIWSGKRIADRKEGFRLFQRLK